MPMSYDVNPPSSLAIHQERIHHLQKEIQGIEDLKASRYWHLFTSQQKERWNKQLYSLRRLLIAHRAQAPVN